MYKLFKQKDKIKKHAESKMYMCPKCISQLIRLKPMSSRGDTWCQGRNLDFSKGGGRGVGGLTEGKFW